MIAAFLEGVGNLCLRDMDVPNVGDEDVLVRVRESGICGSDLHYFREGRIESNVVTEPLVLGHESSGEVVETGARVTHLHPGDRVTIEPGVPCLTCRFCLSGRYNLCDRMRFLGAPPVHGTFREFVSHNALFVHKLPQSVSFEEGACIEPLAVGYHVVERAAVRPGERVLVTGAGPIGLLSMMFARTAGAEVTIGDVDAYRLEIAADMGADSAIEVNGSGIPANAYDCVIEATGNPDVYETVTRSLAKGGRVAVVGMSNRAPRVDLTALMRKEAAIFTVYRYVNCFQPVLALLGAGRIDVKSIISHRFALSDIRSAFDLAGDPDRHKMKIVVGAGH